MMTSNMGSLFCIYLSFSTIILGCLSGIAPGMGTNRNERIHESLKHLVGRNRISAGAVNAIFSLVFYNHNTKKEGIVNIPPIWAKYPDIEKPKVNSNYTFPDNDVKSSTKDPEHMLLTLCDAFEENTAEQDMEHSYSQPNECRYI